MTENMTMYSVHLQARAAIADKHDWVLLERFISQDDAQRYLLKFGKNWLGERNVPWSDDIEALKLYKGPELVVRREITEVVQHVFPANDANGEQVA